MFVLQFATVLFAKREDRALAEFEVKDGMGTR